jgi:hypothetical protein
VPTYIVVADSPRPCDEAAMPLFLDRLAWARLKHRQDREEIDRWLRISGREPQM